MILTPPSMVGVQAILVAASAASYRLTKRSIYMANHFGFGPIKEVAWLFAGIFATMVPVWDYLARHAESLGLTNPLQF